MKLYVKLNIQRFATTVTSNAYETGVDTNNNLSYVYATFTQVASSNTWNTSGSAYYNISCDGKSTGNVSYTFSKGSTKTFSATLGPYYHNADGTLGAKTVTIVVHGDVSGGNHTQTHTVTFTTIPRDFSSTPSISFRSKTDKKIVYNWSTSETCDLIKYHLDGGSAVQVWTGSATSGTFEVSGLTGGTTHSVYADFRRQDSQRSLPSNTVSNITTYKTPTLSLSLTASDETSLTIKATPNVEIKSKSWTLKNSGGTTIATSTSTNESVPFNNLSANTNYTIYVYCVSNDANGAITSATYNATYKTTAYPTVNRINTAELVIGNSQTINISNPKNRTVTVFMKQNASDSDANALYSGTTNVNGDFTFTPTASTLYNKIPAAHNSNCVYYVKYGTNPSATVSGKFKIKETENPTFTTSNWNYTVSNTYNALTGNDNKVVIAGYSTVNFTISSAATSAYGATFTGSASGYVYNWGTGTVQLTKTTTAFISGFNSNVIKVTASDDRGLSTVAARTLTNGVDYVNYAPPTSITASTHRANGIDTATTLTLTGKLGYVGKFGTNGVTNTIASIKYKTKAASSSTWSSEYNLTGYTVDTTTGNFSLTNAQIHQNGSTGGFPVGTKYNVMIIVKDAQGLLGSTTYQVDVTDGKIARDVYQDSNGEYHEGINGRADSNYTQKINGSLNVTGNETVGGDLTLTGRANIPEGFRGKRLNGGTGTAGYMYVCDITNNGTYMNQYIQFDVLQRNRIGTVIMCFSSSGTQGALAISDIKKTGSINVYYLVSNNKLSLYIQKSEAYDDIEIIGLEKGAYSNSLIITWKNTTVASLPSGYSTVSQQTVIADKVGTSNVGSSDRPIYLNAGTATQCNTPASGNYFRGVPFISSGGVMEIGRYIDFHPTNASTADYTKRIDAGTGTTARTLTLPDESGTFLLSNQIGSCCVYKNGDFTITNTADWQEQKVNLPDTFKNTNTGLFTPTSGGIKVLKAGSYLVSGSVNYDCMDNCSLCIYKNNTMKMTVDQPSSTASMRNISVPVYLMECAANDVIYLYARRYGKATTFIRGGRSYLTVTKIA